MKLKSIVTSIAASCLLAALAIAQPPHYTVRDLGPVGGAPGQPFFITNNGLVSGSAGFPDGTQHAVLWYAGWRGDFGPSAFGGQNSMAFGINERAQAVGQAETSTKDPKGEDFCGFKALGLPSNGTTCLPFLWQDGVTTPLPLLGGNNGVANQIDNRGEVVGSAENATPDPGCPAPQMLQFKPVIWENGKVQELPTFAADPDGVAFEINQNGQVVGASGKCSAFNPNSLVNLQPLHALLWQQGTVTDLGNLGGTGQGSGIFAQNLNNQGQVVGASDLPGDANFHAFLWTKETGMRDLGTLPGDVNSVALAIDDAGVVTGVSLDANFNPRAFLWQNGVMTELNTLIPAAVGLYLQFACSINSRGEIIGLASTSTGESHGFLATPANSADLALSEDARKLLQQGLRIGRFGALPKK